MKISHLLASLSLRALEGFTDSEVAGLYYDSRRVEAGGAFFALKGEVADGHRFIDDAVARGACVVFMEEARELPSHVAAVVVDDTRRALAQASAVYYGTMPAGCPTVGVTGTNGKTTITYLLESMLRAAGRHPAVFGTVNYRFEGIERASSHTTPESVDLFRILADFRDAGADSLVLEVSSHALEQKRVDSLRFDVGIFTNLTPEHLDYHGDMESYFSSKRRFFAELLPSSGGRAVINVGDPYGKRLGQEIQGAITYGVNEGAEVRFRDLRISFEGITGMLETPEGEAQFHSPLLGRFNVENLLAAAGAGLALGLPVRLVADALSKASPPPGRMERVENNRGALILVDYAHTSDALEKVLKTGRDLNPRRLLTVFGCGGDRDRTKRPAMGEVAARYSDLVFITSDNPRTEEPESIIDEIIPGVNKALDRECHPREMSVLDGKGYCRSVDRRHAIETAVAALRPGDLLLVAGKGHEDYQILGSERIHFDDREELRRALACGKGNA